MAEMQDCYNAFARNLFDVVNDNNSGECSNLGVNSIISPISIQSSLIFAYMAASGTTADELHDVLKLKTDDRKQLAKTFRHFWTVQCNYGQNLTLKSVNRLFVNNRLSLNLEFNDMAIDYFQSKPEAINFADAAKAAQHINNLVEQDTEQKIRNLLHPNAINGETSALLINALYFKGKFEKPFTPESTIRDDFYVDEKTRVEVDMMYQEDKFKHVFLPELDASAVQLPYAKSDISLLIILPATICGILGLRPKLKDIDLRDIEKKMKIQDVEIAMPRLTIDFDLDLKDSLQQLGICEIFSNTANLGGLFASEMGQKLSAIKHRGYIDINEAGSEAAAVTYLKAVPMMLNMQKVTFKVDHPFLFFIRNSRAIFFAGQFTEPHRTPYIHEDLRLESASLKCLKSA